MSVDRREIVRRALDEAHRDPDSLPGLIWQAGYYAGIADHEVAVVESEPEREPGPRKRAAGWLQDLLDDGPVAVSVIRAAATAAGHSERTLRRAKRDLGVVSGGRSWRRPENMANRAS